ncbi:MAG: glycosyltransferase [Bacteroidia bacterium]|nr:glycosyltransferase [Bacteroidia bacterium]
MEINSHSFNKKTDFCSVNFYLEKYGLYPQLIDQETDKDLYMIVVIPCYNETELVNCLNSIYNCSDTKFPVEVITVINHSRNSSAQLKELSKKTLSEGIEFAKQHQKEKLKFYFIEIELPEKDAGVGLARKVGMDEAVRRFEKAGTKNGVMVCFDADCTCSENYLSEIEKHFFENPKTPAASIQFAHNYKDLNETERKAIVLYELFLRYYVNGLRFAGHPYAFETIGSSMAVRNEAYQKQGGMNKRKAGEDFYFLQKIFPLGNFSEINSAVVYPSARESDRVPFGTGKAVGDFIKGKEILFYDPAIFHELKQFISAVKQNGFEFSAEELKTGLIKETIVFLEGINFSEKLNEIKGNVSDKDQFLKRYFNWFDGFLCLKFVHFLSDKGYPRKHVESIDFSFIDAGLTQSSPESILEAFRQFDLNFRK